MSWKNTPKPFSKTQKIEYISGSRIKFADILLCSYEAVSKSRKRSRTSLLGLIFWMIFEEKYFSYYILLLDQISLSGCLNFRKYWENMCIVVVFKPCCDAIIFEIKLFYLIKPIISTWPKIQDKSLNIVGTKKDEIKNIFEHL